MCYCANGKAVFALLVFACLNRLAKFVGFLAVGGFLAGAGGDFGLGVVVEI